jgi:hypothetical protein
MNKRLEGRDEAILDPELPIIDAHHHLFDRPALRYMLEDYLADAGAGHKVMASVYVETLAMARTQGPEALRPLGEVEFAQRRGCHERQRHLRSLPGQRRHRGPCRLAAGRAGGALAGPLHCRRA